MIWNKSENESVDEKTMQSRPLRPGHAATLHWLLKVPKHFGLCNRVGLSIRLIHFYDGSQIQMTKRQSTETFCSIRYSCREARNPWVVHTKHSSNAATRTRSQNKTFYSMEQNAIYSLGRKPLTLRCPLRPQNGWMLFLIQWKTEIVHL